jgi:Peptidase family S51
MTILLNGNAATAQDLIYGAAPLLQGASKVLLVTAAWGEGEHDEGHVKRALNEVGVRSSFEGGFDRAIQNLSLHHELMGVFAAAPLAARWAELREVASTARSLYREHNSHLIALLREVLVRAQQLDPSLHLAQLLRPLWRGTVSDGRQLLRETLSTELQQLLSNLQENDDRFVALLDRVEARVFDDTGILYHPLWREARARLEARILSADVVLFFGGQLDTLLEGLRFFRLREPLIEAARRGASFVAMSAGAMVLGERIIVYDDFAPERRDFQLFDRGLGLVQKFQLFPHCMDRIQTDDPSNLAYLARRFRYHSCVGLNERSFLQLELSPWRALSWGKGDGVYVFNEEGKKLRYDFGADIFL